MIEPPKAHLLSSETAYIVDTIQAIGPGYIVEQLSKNTGAPEGPSLTLDVTARHKGRSVRVTLLLPITSPELAEQLRDILADSLTTCRDHFTDPAVFEQHIAKCDELNRAHGFIPGTARPRCPGCSAELFGEVALRGACLACYPELSDAQAAELAGEAELEYDVEVGAALEAAVDGMPELRWPDPPRDVRP